MTKNAKLPYNYKPLTMAKKAQIIELFCATHDNRCSVIAGIVDQPLSRVNEVIDKYIKEMARFNQPPRKGDRYIIVKSKIN